MSKSQATAQQQAWEALTELVEEASEVEDDAWDRVMATEIRRSPMFEFCRVLKADPMTCGWSDQQAAKYVDKVLGWLHPDGDDPWAEAFPRYDDALGSFLENWNVVLFPAGAFDRAVAMANARPLRPAGTWSGGYCRFYSLCAYLQRLAGDEPIIVPVVTFGEALGVSAQMVTMYRRTALRHGHLVTTDAAIPHRLATKFRFIPCLTTDTTVGTDIKGMEGQ